MTGTTTRLQRILCPIDSSGMSIHALEQAAACARWSGARLTVLHVTSPVTAGVPALLPSMTERWEERREDAVQDWMDARLDGVRDSLVRIEKMILPGIPAQVIVACAEEIAADLIVIGTHGTSGFEHLMLGSVTEKVLRRASCPVLTVPPHGIGTSRLPFERVLCAIDFSNCSLAALKFAMTAALGSGASLTLAHVLEWPWPEPPAPVFSELPPAEASALLEFRQRRECQALTHLGALVPGMLAGRCHTRVSHGRAYAEILRLASEEHADLIVLGVHSRNVVDMAMLGSTANQLVRHATCPVLTVRR